MEILKRATFSIIQMTWTWQNLMELTLIHFSIWQNQKWWCSGYVLTWRLRQIKVSNLTRTVWVIPESDHSSIYFNEINYSVNLIWDAALQRKMFWRDLDGVNIIRSKIMVKSPWRDHNRVWLSMQVPWKLKFWLICKHLAYNTSDATTGTLRYVDGMTIFYWWVYHQQSADIISDDISAMEIKTLLCLILRAHLRCQIDSLRLLCIPISTSIYVMSIMKVRQFVRQVHGRSVLNCFVYRN